MLGMIDAMWSLLPGLTTFERAAESLIKYQVRSFKVGCAATRERVIGGIH